MEVRDGRDGPIDRRALSCANPATDCESCAPLCYRLAGTWSRPGCECNEVFAFRARTRYARLKPTRLVSVDRRVGSRPGRRVRAMPRALRAILLLLRAMRLPHGSLARSFERCFCVVGPPARLHERHAWASEPHSGFSGVYSSSFERCLSQCGPLARALDRCVVPDGPFAGGFDRHFRVDQP